MFPSYVKGLKQVALFIREGMLAVLTVMLTNLKTKKAHLILCLRGVMTRLFFKPSMSIVYAFFAGIFVSLATSLFTGARLEERLAVSPEIVYFSAFSFLLSSVGLFVVSYGLEEIRNAVARHMGEASKGDAPNYLEADYAEVEFRKRRTWIMFSFAVSIILIFYSVIVLVTGRWRLIY